MYTEFAERETIMLVLKKINHFSTQGVGMLEVLNISYFLILSRDKFFLWSLIIRFHDFINKEFEAFV